ncbi:hypothetical protein Tco_0342241 [Tanacetum coccineum]
MLNKKLQTDHWNEMCYQLLKLVIKQLKNPGSGRIVGIRSLLEVTAAKERIEKTKRSKNQSKTDKERKSQEQE